MEIIPIDTPGALEAAQGALEKGGVIVLPTDTVYGIAARLDRPEAVARIFKIKERPRSKPLPVLVAGLDQAEALGRFSDEARSAVAGRWPGALTVVVPASRPQAVVGGDGNTIGLRMPAHPFALEVLRRSGPLAATSANLSSMPTGESIDRIRIQLGDGVDLYVDGGVVDSAPSEVLSFAGPTVKLR